MKLWNLVKLICTNREETKALLWGSRGPDTICTLWFLVYLALGEGDYNSQGEPFPLSHRLQFLLIFQISGSPLCLPQRAKSFPVWEGIGI